MHPLLQAFKKLKIRTTLRSLSMLCYNVPMTHTFTHLKDQLKEFIPVGQGGLSTLKVALLFTLFAWLQFLFLFTNMGPLTAPDPEMVSAGSYALATGQSFAPTCPDGEDEVVQFLSETLNHF